MPNRHHLSAGNPLHVPDECCCVLSPLAPFVDMSAWAWTFAMTPEIDCECRESMARHPEGEPLVPSRVLAKSVHDRKGDSSTCFGPGTVRQLGAVGQVDRAFARERAPIRQGDRTLPRSCALL